MTDFLLELLSEEIPARMQARAAEQLRVRFVAGLQDRIQADNIATYATPRRLVLHARGLSAAAAAASEERRGPRADAPPAAIDGFLRSTGLAREQLEERDTPKGKFLYATINAPGRPTTALLAELIPQLIRSFDWPKSMRWGEASRRRDALRWVRPLTGIVALFGDAVVPFEIDGLVSGRTTQGHRFMSRGAVEITDAASYAATLRAAHVILDPAERGRIIADGARELANAAGLTLIEDAGLVAENAGLTEWPVPLLGRFDPAFLEVPREIIQLTMRTNQKYFACSDAGSVNDSIGRGGENGSLAPAFVCIANIEAADGGAAIVAGNQKVLAARLADAKFFWDADLKAVQGGGLESFTPKLADIVFHEKLGTLADKVERVAKLARWLVESGAVLPAPLPLLGGAGGGAAGDNAKRLAPPPPNPLPEVGEGAARAALATLAEQAARLCKADLTTATVGEFPEVQGIAGRYLALAQGLDPQVADAIRDHYKPIGQGDDVPTAPVSVVVALADKLDTLIGFFAAGERPTGSRDPYALRRASLGIVALMVAAEVRLPFRSLLASAVMFFKLSMLSLIEMREVPEYRDYGDDNFHIDSEDNVFRLLYGHKPIIEWAIDHTPTLDRFKFLTEGRQTETDIYSFLIDRLKVQQREAGVRHDLIDAVFALGGEDDLVRLLARVHALQAFLQTPDGANLLAGYKRAANILAIEEKKAGATFDGEVDPALLVEPAERGLAAALDGVVPAATAAVAREDFGGAMAALAQLRPAVDAFFEAVIVNAPDAALRQNRLNLLNRLRRAVYNVADFSRIEGESF